MNINFNNHYGFSNPYNQRRDRKVAFKDAKGVLEHGKRLLEDKSSDDAYYWFRDALLDNFKITDEFKKQLEGLSDPQYIKNLIINLTIKDRPTKVNQYKRELGIK